MDLRQENFQIFINQYWRFIQELACPKWHLFNIYINWISSKLRQKLQVFVDGVEPTRHKYNLPVHEFLLLLLAGFMFALLGSTCGAILARYQHNSITAIDECESSPCANGGLCIDGFNTYSCSCLQGFTGSSCETNIDDCASEPCKNGARCIDGIDSYKCVCTSGYTGHNCKNMKKGLWLFEYEHFKGNYIILDGAEGNLCDRRWNDRTRSVQVVDDRKWVLCEDIFFKGKCTILEPGQYRDMRWRLSGGELSSAKPYQYHCSPDPCRHGWCENRINDYSCHCYSGYEGLRCEKESSRWYGYVAGAASAVIGGMWYFGVLI